MILTPDRVPWNFTAHLQGKLGKKKKKKINERIAKKQFGKILAKDRVRNLCLQSHQALIQPDQFSVFI